MDKVQHYNRGNLITSDDGGKTITISTTNYQQTIYTASGTLFDLSTLFNGTLNRSTDGGATWLPVSLASGTDLSSYELSFTTSSDGTFLVIGNYLSKDNGATCTKQPDSMLYSAQNINPYNVDLDPLTSGLQQTITYTNPLTGQTRTASYNPATDTLQSSWALPSSDWTPPLLPADGSLPPKPKDPKLSYTVTSTDGCTMTQAANIDLPTYRPVIN